MLINPVSIIFSPNKQWDEFAETPQSGFAAFIPYLLIMAALPSIAWYYGTTTVGWTIGDGEVTRLTSNSAMWIAIAMYGAVVASIAAIGYSIHWMAETYGSKDSNVMKGLAFASLTATPFFLLGLSGVHPMFWLDLILSFVGITWSTYLLYTGIPKAMHIPEDRGFMFASALLAVAMVIFMSLLGVTTILWDMGIIPVFAD